MQLVAGERARGRERAVRGQRLVRGVRVEVLQVVRVVVVMVVMRRRGRLVVVGVVWHPMVVVGAPKRVVKAAVVHQTLKTAEVG